MKSKKKIIALVAAIVLVAGVGSYFMDGSVVFQGKSVIVKQQKDKQNMATVNAEADLYNSFKSEFLKLGLNESAMLKQLGRSDILYLDTQKNSPELDITLFHALVKLNQEKSSSTDNLKLKKDIQKSLKNVYGKASLQDIKNTAYLISKEDYFKSSTYGFSMNSIAAAKMPFGKNLPLLEGNLGKGGTETKEGSVDVKGIAEKDNENKASEASFAQCVKNKLNKDPGSGAPTGGRGEGTVNPGMSTAPGTEGAKTNKGGFYAGNKISSATTGTVDMSNICGGEEGYGKWNPSFGKLSENGSPLDKAYGFSMKLQYEDKNGHQIGIEISFDPETKGIGAFEGSDQGLYIEGTLTTTISVNGQPGTPSTGTFQIDTNNPAADASAALKDTIDYAKNAAKDGNLKTNFSAPAGGGKFKDLSDKNNSASKYNPESDGGYCGQSVADCFVDGSKDITGSCKSQIIDVKTDGVKAEVVDGAPAPQQTKTIYTGDCGCFGKVNYEGGAGTIGKEGISDFGPGTANKEGASTGCQGDAGKALELANMQMFFTDPSPMLLEVANAASKISNTLSKIGNALSKGSGTSSVGKNGTSSGTKGLNASSIGKMGNDSASK